MVGVKRPFSSPAMVLHPSGCADHSTLGTGPSHRKIELGLKDDGRIEDVVEILMDIANHILMEIFLDIWNVNGNIMEYEWDRMDHINGFIMPTQLDG